MHEVEIRPEIVERVLARRSKYHLWESIDPKKTAFVIIDMQNTFVAESSPAEVPESRAICDNINTLAREARELGARIIWVTHANTGDGKSSDWSLFFNNFVADEVRERTIASLAPGGEGQHIWHTLEVEDGDLKVQKNRYSALIPGSSSLERILRGYGIETMLVAGTKTNVCCESTGRDGMMLDFNVVMVSDCLAALSDDEHLATLETFIQQFGDVMTSEEVLAVLRNKPNVSDAVTID